MNAATETARAKTRTKRTVRLSVSIKIPAGCNEEDVIGYAKEALRMWCKGYCPGDECSEQDRRFDMNEGITIRHEGKVV
jgi:hypothetical protein